MTKCPVDAYAKKALCRRCGRARMAWTSRGLMCPVCDA